MVHTRYEKLNYLYSLYFPFFRLGDFHTVHINVCVFPSILLRSPYVGHTHTFRAWLPSPVRRLATWFIRTRRLTCVVQCGLDYIPFGLEDWTDRPETSSSRPIRSTAHHHFYTAIVAIAKTFDRDSVNLNLLPPLRSTWSNDYHICTTRQLAQHHRKYAI